MLRMITQGRELKEDWKTLAVLRLREPYGIHVMRRPAPTTHLIHAPQMAAARTALQLVVLHAQARRRYLKGSALGLHRGR